MIELEMHWSSGYYHNRRISSPLDPHCCNCPFMPDNECGWGYQGLDECVFQLNGEPYWYNAYDACLNEKYNDRVLKPDTGINELIGFLDDVADLHKTVDGWNFRSQRLEFYENTWLLRKKISEYGYELNTGFDYIIWSYSREPCAVCGEVTERFVLYGGAKEYGSENAGNVIKLCEHCSDIRWMSSYNR